MLRRARPCTAPFQSRRAVCASPPPSITMWLRWLKWSRWSLKLATAVGSGEAIRTVATKFSSCSRRTPHRPASTSAEEGSDARRRTAAGVSERSSVCRWPSRATCRASWRRFPARRSARLALAEHLQPRRIAEGSLRNQADPASTQNPPRHRPALRDGRIDRVASGGSVQIGLRLMRPHAVRGRTGRELSGIAFAPFESAKTHAPMRKGAGSPSASSVFFGSQPGTASSPDGDPPHGGRSTAPSLPDADIDVVEPVDAIPATLDHEPR